MTPIEETARALQAEKTRAAACVEACLDAIAHTDGEGERVFLSVFSEAARAQAGAIDAARKRGEALPPFAGIPVSVKDLFDTAASVTRCASRVLADAPAAMRDARCIANLKALGFIIIGRTNMTEFAYSGLGVNPHFGTPLNPFERHVGRIPGGSSSGAAVSVCDTMAHGAIGSDTGGSCRIPASLCGCVGFKPTTKRISMRGIYPLARSFDAPGPLAPTVSCCAILDDALCGGDGADVTPAPVAGLRIGVLSGYVNDDLDTRVARDYTAAVSRIGAAGAHLRDVRLPGMERLPALNRGGGIAGAEAYALHKPMLDAHRALYDPWIVSRIEMARGQEAVDYLAALAARREIRRAVDDHTAHLDALLAPTTPIIAPTFAEIEGKAASFRKNFLLLRNTSVFNFLDRPAISIPCHAPRTPPTGLMIAGKTGQDRALLSIARALEPIVRQDAEGTGGL